MYRGVSILVFSLLLLGGVGAGGKRELLDLLPDPFEGFDADDEGPFYYPLPDSLIELYNGGYMVYVDRGVVSALSQAYYSDSSYYTLVLHDINSPANASNLVAYFRNQISEGFDIGDLGLGDGGFEYSYGQTNFLYFSTGEIFVTLQGGDGTGDAVLSIAREVHSKYVTEPLAFAVALLAIFSARSIYVK